ncbi:MAG: DMT family transporter [Kofleriaceae bacterium]
MVSLSPGVALMALAALCFSLMSVGVKLAVVTVPLGEVVFARALVTLSLSYWLCRRAGLRPLGRARGRLLLRGLLGFGGLSAYYGSLGRLPLAEATTIHHVTPLLTAVAAWLLLGERLTARTSAAIGLGLGGVVLVALPELGGASAADPVGVTIAIAGACCAALAYVTVRRLAREEHPLVIVLYFPLVAVPLALPWMAADCVWPTAREAALLLGIGVATQGGQVFLTRALASMPAGRATALGYVQVPMAVTWSVVLFGEALPWSTWIGIAVLGVGTYLAARQPRRAAGTP